MNDLEDNVKTLNSCFNKVIRNIGEISIGNKKQFPFGWRKAAKGRTVWRIVEEAIVQNAEKYFNNSNESDYEVKSSDSEVGVYDLTFRLKKSSDLLYINIKSSVKDGKKRRDDISKASKLKDFYEEDINKKLFIATFIIEFTSNMTINICRAIVKPINWISDIYVNPSNNGNLQSAEYKSELSETRTNEEFLTELKKQINISNNKKINKINKS